MSGRIEQPEWLEDEPFEHLRLRDMLNITTLSAGMLITRDEPAIATSFLEKIVGPINVDGLIVSRVAIPVLHSRIAGYINSGLDKTINGYEYYWRLLFLYLLNHSSLTATGGGNPLEMIPGTHEADFLEVAEMTKRWFLSETEREHSFNHIEKGDFERLLIYVKFNHFRKKLVKPENVSGLIDGYLDAISILKQFRAETGISEPR